MNDQAIKAIEQFDFEAVVKLVNKNPSMVVKAPANEMALLPVALYCFISMDGFWSSQAGKYYVDDLDRSKRQELLRKSEKIIRFLVANGAHLDEPMSQGIYRGFPPFRIAIHSSRAVKLLVELGADPRKKTEFGGMPPTDLINLALSQAVTKTNNYERDSLLEAKELIHSAEILCNAGCELQAKSAVAFESVQEVESRLEREQPLGEFTIPSILGYAISLSKPGLLENIDAVGLARIALDYKKVHRSVLPYDKPTGWLIEAGVRASDKGIEVVRLLLDAGADANQRDREGRTLLKGLIQDTKRGWVAPEQAKKGEALLREFGGKLQGQSTKKKPAKKKTSSSKSTAKKTFIDEILNYLEAPESPANVDEKGLKKTVKKLKTELPDDFIEFMRLFGSGRIIELAGWELMNPFNNEMIDGLKYFQSWWDEMGEDFDEDLAIYPEKNGFLPCLRLSDSMVHFGWEVKGKPNTWKMIEFDDEQPYKAPMVIKSKLKFTEFLHQKLTRQIPMRQNYNGEKKFDYKTDISFEPADEQWRNNYG